MGLFDKFRKRVRNISEETNTEDLTEINSQEPQIKETIINDCKKIK